jgi:hypothetical protein
MQVLKAVAMGVVAACGIFLGQIGPTQPWRAHRQRGAPRSFPPSPKTDRRISRQHTHQEAREWHVLLGVWLKQGRD